MSIIKLLSSILFALLALASAAITAFLFYVGVENNWTSDGPGMLLIYIGLPLFVLATLAFGWITLSILTGSGSQQTQAGI